MHRARSLTFTPSLVAIVYGIWLINTSPPGGFADLAGVIVIGIGVLSAVLCAVYLIADVYWWHGKAQWWRDILAGVLCVLLAMGGFVLLGRA